MTDTFLIISAQHSMNKNRNKCLQHQLCSFVVVVVVQELSIDFSKFVYQERNQNEIILMN